MRVAGVFLFAVLLAGPAAAAEDTRPRVEAGPLALWAGEYREGDGSCEGPGDASWGSTGAGASSEGIAWTAVSAISTCSNDDHGTELSQDVVLVWLQIEDQGLPVPTYHFVLLDWFVLRGSWYPEPYCRFQVHSSLELENALWHAVTGEGRLLPFVNEPCPADLAPPAPGWGRLLP